MKLFLTIIAPTDAKLPLGCPQRDNRTEFGAWSVWAERIFWRETFKYFIQGAHELPEGSLWTITMFTEDEEWWTYRREVEALPRFFTSTNPEELSAFLSFIQDRAGLQRLDTTDVHLMVAGQAVLRDIAKELPSIHDKA